MFFRGAEEGIRSLPFCGVTLRAGPFRARMAHGALIVRRR